MNTMRILYHLALADFYERVRRYSFLLTLAAVIILGVLVNNGTLGMDLNSTDPSRSLIRFHGELNSAWIGTMTVMVINVILGFFGFYLVNGNTAAGVYGHQDHFPVDEFITAQVGHYGHRPGTLPHTKRFPLSRFAVKIPGTGIEIHSFGKTSFGLIQDDARTLTEGHHIICSAAARKTVYRMMIISDRGIVDIAEAVDLPRPNEAQVDKTGLPQVTDIAQAGQFIGMVLCTKGIGPLW